MKVMKLWEHVSLGHQSAFGVFSVTRGISQKIEIEIARKFAGA